MTRKQALRAARYANLRFRLYKARRAVKSGLLWLGHDFNDWLGTRLAAVLSSMGLFWVILALTVAPLYAQRPASLIGWITYAVQTIFQGAALPLLGYVADKGSKVVLNYIKDMHLSIVGKMDKTVEDINAKVTEELAIVKAENAELREAVGLLHELVTELHQHHIGGEHRAHKRSQDTRRREALEPSERRRY